jgi:hypothetical protein
VQKGGSATRTPIDHPLWPLFVIEMNPTHYTFIAATNLLGPLRRVRLADGNLIESEKSLARPTMARFSGKFEEIAGSLIPLRGVWPDHP